jgi:hypothetical protein
MSLSLLRVVVAPVGRDHALQLDGHRVALAVDGLAGGDADPALADAVLVDIGLLDAVEHDAHAALEDVGVVVRAAGVGGQAVGRRVAHGIVFRRIWTALISVRGAIERA